ncbi:hypothetical protein ElyMa_007031000 [Elysia marginata]|uniref:Uncharacterized protein n=1 Tax=Elysia marginata TaxID=1093978 RepID=A0AAV4JV58_9GAST|nr:hypothetical protein ElyMa_007031000 [Elysia marginata]
MFLVAAVCSLNPREASQRDSHSHRLAVDSHGGSDLVTAPGKPGVFYALVYVSTHERSKKAVIHYRIKCGDNEASLLMVFFGILGGLRRFLFNHRRLRLRRSGKVAVGFSYILYYLLLMGMACVIGKWTCLLCKAKRGYRFL